MRKYGIVLLYVMSTIICFGQFEQSYKRITITKSDGSVIEVLLISMDTDSVSYMLDNKLYHISMAEVSSLSIQDANAPSSQRDSTYRVQNRRDYDDTYFYFNSARPIGAGQTYYRNYSIVVNKFGLGVSEKFSLSGGFETISLFTRSNLPIFYIEPKLSVRLNEVDFAAGTYVIVSGGDIGALYYVNMTLGTESNHFTAGLYKVYGFSALSVLNISGCLALSPKVNFMIEYTTLPSTTGFNFLLTNIGLRFRTSKDVLFDVSILRDFYSSGVAPSLSFTIPL